MFILKLLSNHPQSFDVILFIFLSNKTYCSALCKNILYNTMVHGEARAECCYFKFLDSVSCSCTFFSFVFIFYSLCHTYPSNQPMAVFKWFNTHCTSFFIILIYILSVSLSVEMAVVVVLLSFGTILPIYVPVFSSKITITV